MSIDLVKDLPDEQIQVSPNIAKKLEDGLDLGWLELLGLIPKYEEEIGKPNPFEPQDPMDCVNWPNSPFCGGGWNPFEPIGFDTEIVYNECEVCVRLTPVFLGFSGAPLAVICKRLDDCQPSPPPPPIEQPPLGEPLPPPIIPDYPDDCEMFVGITNRASGGSSSTWFGETSTNLYSSGTIQEAVAFDESENRVYFKTTTYKSSSHDNNAGSTGTFSGVWSYVLGDFIQGSSQGTMHIRYESGDVATYGFIQHATWAEIKKRHFNPPYNSYSTSGGADGNSWSSSSSFSRSPVVFWSRDGCVPVEYSNTPPPPPPLPPPPPPCDCMNCCCNSQDNEDHGDLLRYIAYKMGTEELPAELPVSMVGNDPATTQIPSVVSLLGWKIKQDDAVFGEWPVELKVVTDEGQEKPMTLHNVAEFAAEAVGTGISTALDADNTYSVVTKSVFEVLALKAMLIEALDLINATNDFLGFKVDEVERDIDCQFDLSKADNPTEFFKEKTLKTRGWKNADKVTLLSYLEREMFILTILKETFYKTGTPEKLAADIKTMLTKLQEEGQGGGEADDSGEFNSLLEKINGDYSAFLSTQGVPPIRIDPTI